MGKDYRPKFLSRLIKEINNVRKDPASFADKLLGCKQYFTGNILRMQEKYPDSWQYRLIISVEEGYSRETDVIEQVKLATNGEVEVNLHSNPESHANQIFKAYDFICENVL